MFHRAASRTRSAHTLRRLIDGAPDLTNAIIFCNRKRDVATLYRSLERHGYSVGALHGDMDQHSRLRTLDSFRDGKIKLLVASDVAARGLDIPAVSHIFNFDVPTHSEDYVHRIGRTGRAGRSGAALTIVTKPETKYIQLIEKLIGKDIEWVTAPDVVHAAASESDGHVRHHRDRGERGGNRRRREGRGERQHSEPTRTERPVQANERPAAAPAQQQASNAERPRREAEADQGRAVGFSDHVPAFLLRPVRIPSRPEALEEV